jgi:hypothetical protein
LGGEGKPEGDRMGGEGDEGGVDVLKAGWRCTGDQMWLRAKS